jgi:Lipid A 3-O-deacylase (PagL)
MMHKEIPKRWIALLIQVLITLSSLICWAEPAIHKSRNIVGVFGEFGFYISPLGGLNPREAKANDLIFAGLHYRRVMAETEMLSYQYSLEIFPMIWSKQVEEELSFSPSQNLGKKTVYGFGVAPVGVQMNFKPESLLHPFLSFHAGVVRFQHNIPFAKSSRYNFVLEAGVGIEKITKGNQSVEIGFKLHHLSNGGISGSNPGINSCILYVGLNFIPKSLD